ncbi:MarR family transcriptional regulator [Gordonia sihwensis]|uniref:MarR family transcriptional regulator n=1 Tax=Gordonia sihwensis TaxID=173559 RepID=UPI0005EFF76B|nr:MarR family transcriptional regulator [Gordonia sihwensis]KJR07636.1 IclR family transcriptional regulator [Gordonia sihwensis]MBY4570745.1 IclR family transcriptional regulator [Gordonia sihwensis]
MAGSPPTRRVIDTLELLARVERPQTIAEIADELGVARATMSAILAELDDAGWAERDASRAYRLGPAAMALGGVSPPALHLPNPDVAQVLDELVAATDCGVTLARMAPDAMTVVAKRHSEVRPVPGLGLGQSLAIVFPVGAAAMAWREADQEAWLGERDRPRRRLLLESVRRRGFAAYRPESSDAMLVEVLAELLGAVGPLLIDPALRHTATRRLAQLSSRAYSDDELDGADAQPISYLAAPVFAGDQAEFELQLGVLKSAVDGRERRRLVTALVEAADRISALI